MFTEEGILEQRKVKDNDGAPKKIEGRYKIIPFSKDHPEQNPGEVHLGNFLQRLVSVEKNTNMRIGTENEEGVVPIFILRLNLFKKNILIQD